MVALIYIVSIIKSYIIIVLAVGLSVFIFYRFISPFKNIVIRGFVILAFLIAVLIAAFVTNFSSQLKLLGEESMVQVDSFKRNYDDAQNEDDRSRATLETKEIDPSLSGMIAHSPVAIFTCLYRPFIWESKKIFIVFSSFESLLLLLCTLYIMVRLKFFGFFTEILANPFVLVSIIMSILFALIIGFTTYNFGTMARYRIILLPFYLFTLVSLYTTYLDKKKISA